MWQRHAGPTRLFRRAYREARENRVSFTAAGMAYYALVSFLPTVLLALAVATTFGGDALADRFIATLGGWLTESGRRLLVDLVTEPGGRDPATLGGLVVLGWGTLRLFRGLETAFTEIYAESARRDALDRLAAVLISMGAVGVAIAGTVATGMLLVRLDGGGVGVLVEAGRIAGLALVLFPLYYVLPAVDLAPRDVLPGVLVAALGWSLLEVVFRLYVEFAGSLSIYGAFGVVILLVTWLYAGSSILLFGAVLNAVYARGSRGW